MDITLGVPADCLHCPTANALTRACRDQWMYADIRVSVGPEWIWLTLCDERGNPLHYVTLETPMPVTTWIARFDNLDDEDDPAYVHPEFEFDLELSDRDMANFAEANRKAYELSAQCYIDLWGKR